MTSPSRRLLLSLALALPLLWGATTPAVAQRPPRKVTNPAQPHRHTPACRRWVPPKVIWRTERVREPGGTQKVWVPPVYRTGRDRRGNPIQILVRPGHYRLVKKPSRWVVRRRKETIPGHWEYICGHPPR